MSEGESRLRCVKMIVGHEHRYLFIALPRTGSTAISRELIRNYGGEEILRKHATYRDFARTASEKEKQYFTFSAIRNPMDKILSLYFKYKTNKRDYENPDIYRGNNLLIRSLMQSQFRFVQNHNATFSEFFERFYYLPYDDWSSLDHKNMDFVIRFEHLPDDFEKALSLIGLSSVRPLPTANKTSLRSQDYWSYFEPEIQSRAQWVFYPYFRRWGYEFPDTWQIVAHPGAEAVFKFANIFRRFYWRFLR